MNDSPSGDGAVQLGNPDFELAQLSLHTGERELRRPRLRFGTGHFWWCKLKDGTPPNGVETTGVIACRSTVNGIHRHLPRVKLGEPMSAVGRVRPPLRPTATFMQERPRAAAGAPSDATSVLEHIIREKVATFSYQ